MQINGTTLNKRQKALIGGALLREQTRATDAMRIIDMTAVHPPGPRPRRRRPHPHHR